jgi:hypothetical protein
MIFTNARSQHSYIGNIIQQNKAANATIPMVRYHRPIPTPVPVTTTTVAIEENKPKKMKWGEPTWFLFHVLAEKVKEDQFANIRVELLNMVYMICSNLPCPDCANHATVYLNGINYKAIQTKEQFKQLFFVFHNTVNAKKNFPIFPRDELESKYSQMELIPIIYNFMSHFQDKHKSIRMIANDFYRSRISDQLKQWFNANIRYFDK